MSNIKMPSLMDNTSCAGSVLLVLGDAEPWICLTACLTMDDGCTVRNDVAGI